MATIYNPEPNTFPSTPTKGGVTSQSEEVKAPDYSPGAVPEYPGKPNDSTVTSTEVPEESSSDAEVTAQRRKKKPTKPEPYPMPRPIPDDPVKIMPMPMPIDGQFSVEHPIYPGGNILRDIQTHLECHNFFSLNIKYLVNQFIEMRTELESTRNQLSEVQRELWHERSEKERYKAEVDDLKLILKDVQNELYTARTELELSEKRLKAAVKQLRETVSRLEIARKALKDVTRERDDFARIIKNLEQDIIFYKGRIASLELEIQSANKSLEAANEREARLTKLLFECETQKARLSQERDTARFENGKYTVIITELRSEINNLKTVVIRDLNLEIERLKRQIRAPVLSKHWRLNVIGDPEEDHEYHILNEEDDHEAAPPTKSSDPFTSEQPGVKATEKEPTS